MSSNAMKQYHFLAFDLGATSGRAVLGTFDGIRFEMNELSRFPNAMFELHGKFYWNLFGLYNSIKEGLKICAKQGLALTSIGIDTWGVDFGYVGKDGTILGLPRAYRDPYTNGAPEDFFKLIPREEVYRLTGIQVMNFNSLYQLYRAKKTGFAPLEQAEKILFMPDLLSYMLTGKQVCEYTVASTTQILNPATRQFESSLLEVAGLKASLLPPLVDPGTVIGTLTDALAEEIGIGKIPVVAVAGHDTASAVLAVPAENPNFAYLSSGTWSLMGVELLEPITNEASCNANFTNEGGYDYRYRYLKNIAGLWLLQSVHKEIGNNISYADLVVMARESVCDSIFDVNDDRFASPDCMVDAIRDKCRESGLAEPQSLADFARCIFLSLADSYANTMRNLQVLTGTEYDSVNIIGGGSQNDFLNQLTATACGLPVYAGPAEGTALGNIVSQMIALGVLPDIKAAREIIRNSFDIREVQP